VHCRDAVAIVVGLVFIGQCRAVVHVAADAVAVAVVVGVEGTAVAGIADAVAIVVGLVFIASAGQLSTSSPH
jgi:hypothetical protein